MYDPSSRPRKTSPNALVQTGFIVLTYPSHAHDSSALA
jgi:hypothetical protein